MAMDRNRRGVTYLPLRDAIDQLFEGSVIAPQGIPGQGGYPQVDLFVTDDDVVLEMALPGANPDEVNISVTGETVTVSGEIKHTHRTQRAQPYLAEIWEGKFQRSFNLPIQVDANQAEANYEGGILALRLPKSEATKPRKVQISQSRTIQGQSRQTDQSEKEKVSVNSQ